MQRIVLALLALCVSGVWAEVKPNAMFSNQAVLQQQTDAPVYGTANAGENVTVEFRGTTRTTATGPDGKWLLRIPTGAAGGPFTLKINNLTLEDILVGEVWVGSGQSNMDMVVGNYTAGDEVLKKLAEGGPYPQLRLARRRAGGWTDSSPANAARFSALCFAFGLQLQQQLGVPVGLLVGAVGGTPSGFWLSEQAFADDQPCRDVIAKYAATYNFETALKNYDVQVKDYEAKLAKWKENEADNKAKNIRPPGAPRKPVKAGECYGKVGNLYEANIRPFLPYAIKGVLWDQGESGTAIEGVDQYTLMGALIRGWRKEWQEPDFPFLYVQKPSGGGPAWDYTDPVSMRANKLAPLPAQIPDSGHWREIHLRIREYPHTYMVTATDLGDGVHPVNKSGYGARAARVALGAVYGRPLEYYGPLFKEARPDGARLVVSFTHVGKGLAFKGGDKLQGFAIAGDDHRWVWADAAIVGDTVVLTSPLVAKPVGVRYAWGQTHPWANLFNQDGLPAQAFRSVTW